MPPPILARATPWLRPEALASLESIARTEEAAEPRRWDAHLARHGRSRFLRVTTHSLRALAADYDVAMAFPILDSRFVSALAAAGGGAGFGDRTAVMRAVFTGTLPDELIWRKRKAEFGAALWRTEARAFAERWDGTGVDLERIDAEKLREVWRAESPLFGSSTLLQMAWLAAQES